MRIIDSLNIPTAHKLDLYAQLCGIISRNQGLGVKNAYTAGIAEFRKILKKRFSDIKIDDIHSKIDDTKIDDIKSKNDDTKIDDIKSKNDDIYHQIDDIKPKNDDIYHQIDDTKPKNDDIKIDDIKSKNDDIYHQIDDTKLQGTAYDRLKAWRAKNREKLKAQRKRAYQKKKSYS